MQTRKSPGSLSEDSNMDLEDRGQLFPRQSFQHNSNYERTGSLRLSTTPMRSPPFKSPTLRRGSYIEDEDNTLGNYIPSPQASSGRVASTFNTRREGKKAHHEKVSSRQTVRRPQIQGPQPQPLQPSMITPLATTNFFKISISDFTYISKNSARFT